MNLKYFFTILILLLSSCRYEDHLAQIYPHTNKLNFNKIPNSDINVYVEDKRVNPSFIGFRSAENVWELNLEYKNPEYFSGYTEGYYYRTSVINSEENLAGTIKQKFLSNLGNKGLKPNNISANKLRIEILELNFFPTLYRNFVISKMKVVAFNSSKTIEKIYNKELISYKPMMRALLLGPIDFGPDNDYYDKIINQAVDENIEQIFNDEELWKLLINKNESR